MRFAFSVMLYLCFFGLVACGGGGGGGGAPLSPSGGGGGGGGAPPPASLQVRSIPPGKAPSGTKEELGGQKEYLQHPELQSIGAVQAHAKGFYGEGATIGVVDEDVQSTLRDFGGTVDAVKRSHGSIVASLAAGHYEGVEEVGLKNIVGVAPRAKLVTIGVPLGAPSQDSYQAVTLEDLQSEDAGLTSWISRIIAEQVDVANFSFGHEGVITDSLYMGTENNYAPLKSALAGALSALRQDGKQDKVVFVIAAGNAGNEGVNANHPEVIPGLSVVLGEDGSQSPGNPYVIAVAATQPTDPAVPGGAQMIADYSNRCGVAKDYCIAAPGQISAYTDGSYDPKLADKGTSFAAPRVSGAIAVLVGWTTTEDGVRQMTRPQLVKRLFDTAAKSGIFNDQDTYGQGFLDLAAAVQPVGDMEMTTGSSLDGPSYSLEFSRLAAGHASGDALQRAFAGRHLMAFDELDFPFPVSFSAVLDAGAARRVGERALLRELDRLGGDDRWSASWGSGGFAALVPGAGGASSWFGAEGDGGLFPSGGADLGGHLGLLEAPAGVGYSRALGGGSSLRAGLFSESGGEEGSGGAGVVVQLRPGLGGMEAGAGAGRELRLTAGLLQRDGHLLDTWGRGAFEPSGSGTLFAGVGGRHEFGGGYWLSYGGSLGWTRWKGLPGTMLVGGEPLLTSELELGVGAGDVLRAGDRLGLRLHQPLRVERGAARVGYAVRRTPEREVIRGELEASLEPSGRRVDLEGVYRVPLGVGLEAGVLLRWVREPGHVRGATGEWEALGALRLGL